MFYNLFDCMHACILHVLSVRLTRVITEGYLEQKNSPEIQKVGYTRGKGGTPQNFRHCETKLYFTSQTFRHTGTKL